MITTYVIMIAQKQGRAERNLPEVQSDFVRKVTDLLTQHDNGKEKHVR